MRNYDQELRSAKSEVTRALMDSAGRTVDDLNKAWDNLTDALVRQREERNLQILRLLDELSEAKKKTV